MKQTLSDNHVEGLSQNVVKPARSCRCRSVTSTAAHHFFGYYDKCPWSPDEMYLATMQAPFADRHPTPHDPLAIGVIDGDADGSFHQIAETRAWNWQQGCMLRWHPRYRRMLMFNDRVGSRFVTVGVNLETGQRIPLLDMPAYDISQSGQWVASLNFARVGECRPGYGYVGGPTEAARTPQPKDDGLFLIDLETGENRLAVSIRAAGEVGDVRPAETDVAWFNHAAFNPGGSRILFLHRWAAEACPGHTGFTTRVMILDVASGALRCVSEGRRASHFDWRDDNHLLIFLYHQDGPGYYLIDVRTGHMEPVGKGRLSVDGHCVYRPQRDWFATDTYPSGEHREQTLMLYHPDTGQRVDIGRFSAAPVSDPSLRCDLHARWDRRGRRLCFDSTHEHGRQMYVIDVGHIVDGSDVPDVE